MKKKNPYRALLPPFALIACAALVAAPLPATAAGPACVPSAELLALAAEHGASGPVTCWEVPAPAAGQEVVLVDDEAAAVDHTGGAGQATCTLVNTAVCSTGTHDHRGFLAHGFTNPTVFVGSLKSVLTSTQAGTARVYVCARDGIIVTGFTCQAVGNFPPPNRSFAHDCFSIGVGVATCFIQHN